MPHPQPTHEGPDFRGWHFGPPPLSRKDTPMILPTRHYDHRRSAQYLPRDLQCVSSSTAPCRTLSKFYMSGHPNPQNHILLLGWLLQGGSERVL